jgi:hypothetical protein
MPGKHQLDLYHSLITNVEDNYVQWHIIDYYNRILASGSSQTITDAIQRAKRLLLTLTWYTMCLDCPTPTTPLCTRCGHVNYLNAVTDK